MTTHINLPPLTPGWAYKPMEPGGFLHRLIAFSQIEDLPLLVQEDTAPALSPIYKEIEKA